MTVAGDPPSHSADLTARARIRDAAIALFGRDGFSKTSVRAIAAQAGVSAALVIHHFGSKEGLRRACDRFVVDDLIGGEEKQLNADLTGTMQRWLAEPEVFRPAFEYVTRALLEGSELGDLLFDDLLKQTERMLAEGAERGEIDPGSDPQTMAALLAVNGWATLLLERHIGRVFGESGLNAKVLQRMTIPTLELYTHGIYTSTALLDAAKAILRGTPR